MSSSQPFRLPWRKQLSKVVLSDFAGAQLGTCRSMRVLVITCIILSVGKWSTELCCMS